MNQDDKNKCLVLQFYQEVFNKRQLAKIYDFFSEAAVIELPGARIYGVANIRSTIGRLLESLSVYQIKVNRLQSENRLIIAYCTWIDRGGETLSWHQASETRNRTELHIFRIVEGKIVEYSGHGYIFELLQQSAQNS